MHTATSVIDSANSTQIFEKISPDSVKKGEHRLVAGGFIVFDGGKKAEIKPLTGYTFSVAGCLKYYHPYFEKECYIKVENNRLISNFNKDIGGIDHFLLPKK